MGGKEAVDLQGWWWGSKSRPKACMGPEGQEVGHRVPQEVGEFLEGLQ